MLLAAKQSDDSKRTTSWLEWVVFGVGAVLLIATLGLLIYETFIFEKTPPNITITLGEPDHRGGKYNVPVKAQNTGSATAAVVQIQVTAYFSGGAREDGQITFDFVPMHASRNGWVTFERPPSEADSLRARVLGYLVP
ncbi:MAG TPA: hypothetical protein VFG50_08600 [Rhodothermales bacterium]|nr:hypothetical protein [Rhodothermales bacterium]